MHTQDWEATVATDTGTVTLTVQADSLPLATLRAGIALAHKGYSDAEISGADVHLISSPHSLTDSFRLAFGGIALP